MELEGSLPHSQVPTTCPYPEPAPSSPYPHIPLPADPGLYAVHTISLQTANLRTTLKITQILQFYLIEVTKNQTTELSVL